MGAKRYKKPTKAQHDTFFKVLAESGNVTGAARASLLPIRQVYLLRESDNEWADDWADAQKMANDAIEAEIRRRAMSGVDRIALSAKGIVYQKDGTELKIKEYSDQLLIVHARANMPEKYGEMANIVIPPLPADLAPDPKPTPDEDAPPDLVE